ncbi:MAG: NlpC/P60 family protein [Verrucomicrobiales bacterium]
MNRLICALGIFAAALGSTPIPSRADEAQKPAETSSVAPEAIRDFAKQPEPVRRLLTEALALTEKGLTYTYGSADPAQGGMDCSGAVYYLLGRAGVGKAPRSSAAQYRWAWEAGTLYPVIGSKADTFELSELRPGDLLFWTGTYDIDRDPPITHVMIYAGRLKKDGQHIMVGASDGRSFGGKARHGVGVFDFKFPHRGAKEDSKSRFVGYARIPGLVPPPMP